MNAMHILFSSRFPVSNPGMLHPISPLLFDFVADALDAILSKARVAGHIEGVVPHLIPSGVSHLQYADDTMILLQNIDSGIRNLKFILLCFELLSGM
jgi:hypothetical protein